MERPYIICHMVTSIDGKVTGDFLSKPESLNAVEVYYDINRKFKSNGFICGRVTMETSFTNGWYPDLSQYGTACGMLLKEDYIPSNLSGFYAVAFDTNGKLGWKTNRIIDDDPGYGGAQIIEVLSEDVDVRYLAYLRRLEIPYIFAGEYAIDVKTALQKLKGIGAQTLLLEGGSVINGAFQRANVIDELSLVVAPLVADAQDKPLFTDSNLLNYNLMQAKTENNVLVLQYKKA